MHELSTAVDVSALLCFKQCDHGPNVSIGNKALNTCMAEEVIEEIRKAAIKHD